MKDVLMLIRSGADEGALLRRAKDELGLLVKKGNIIGAFDSNIMIGIVALDVYSERMAELRSFYVAKNYRSRGIGKRLVGGVIKMAKDRGIEEIMTITLKDKKNWFIRNGFGEDAHGFKVALFRKP